MTYDQLFQVAEKRGVVRWTKSNIVEFLRLTKSRKIIAQPIAERKRVHIIRGHANIAQYNCTEIGPKQFAQLFGTP